MGGARYMFLTHQYAYFIFYKFKLNDDDDKLCVSAIATLISQGWCCRSWEVVWAVRLSENSPCWRGMKFANMERFIWNEKTTTSATLVNTLKKKIVD